MKKAFTLIELMVVIGIVGLLVAILVPALGHARGAARMMKCQSNLRQIGLAWFSYLEEHDETFPVWTKSSLFYRYGGREEPNRPRPLNRFAADAEVFRCPADGVLENRLAGRVRSETDFERLGNNYYGNIFILQSFVKDELKYWHGVRLPDISVDPVKLLVAGDAQWYQRYTNSDWNAHFHNDDHIVNVLFLDGHVEPVEMVPLALEAADYVLPYFDCAHVPQQWAVLFDAYACR